MSSKTKKVKDTTPKNKTRKKKIKTHDETVFKIDGVVIHGSDGKKLRMIQKYKDSTAPITRKLNKGKDYWKPDTIKIFNYLIKKYKKRKTNYILDEEDKKEIKKIQMRKIKPDEDTPTPTKKEEDPPKEPESKKEEEPQKEPESIPKPIERIISSDEDLEELTEIPEEPKKLENK